MKPFNFKQVFNGAPVVQALDTFLKEVSKDE